MARSGKDYVDVEKKVRALVSGIIVKKDFIFDLLAIYGFSKNKIKALRDGNSLTKKPGRIVSRNELLFETVNVDTLFPVDLKETFDALCHDSEVARHKTRFVVATDFQTFCAYDVKTEEQLETPLAELADHWDFFLPWLGHEKYKIEAENQADVKAAEKMGQIYDEIVKSNPDFLPKNSRALNLFLTRLLFCFYAEDSDIFEEQSFTKLINEQTDESGEGMNGFLADFFASLDADKKSNLPKVFQKFPYVNGSLFSERAPIPLITKKARKLIIESGNQDWNKINPDIFGSMFQAVGESGLRGSLGQHYTSVPNIMKVIKPLFLDALNEDFEEVKNDVKGLEEFWNRLASIKFFDPACGSGNFLIIAYKQIRILEIDVIKKLTELRGKYLKVNFSRIKLENFYGLEIDDFARETAILSLWLAEHQMNRRFKEEFGEEIPTLPLKHRGNIECVNALRVDWKKFCPRKKDDEVYIFGNPPYLGRGMQTEEQKKDLQGVFAESSLTLTSKKNINVNLLDYVSCWFILATLYIKDCQKSKFAFVSTNSICQGEQIAVLWPHIFYYPVEIEFAYTSFKWSNNAKFNAGVTCVIVGIRNKESKKPKYLFANNLRKKVDNINAYLNNGVNVIVHKSKSSISGFPPMSFGSMPNDDGNLLLSDEDKEAILEIAPESSKFIRKLIGSQEFIKGISRWCLWVKEEDRKEAERNPFIRERFTAVEKFRAKSPRLQTRKLAQYSYRFGEVRHIDSTSIIIPCVSSERREYIPIGFLDSNSIILNSAEAIYNAPKWIFGVISSRMHMVWVRSVGGRLEERLRYSAELCYNTFPFPEIGPDRRRQIENCVDKILKCRERYGKKTMAELYDSDVNDPSKDKMPADLRMAHRQLDLVIDKCYREKGFNDDEERLETLLKLYQKAVSN